MAIEPNDTKSSQGSATSRPSGDGVGAGVKLAAAETVAALRFLIMPVASTKHIPAKGDRAAMTIQEQPAVIIGGPRQVNWTLGSMNESDVLPEGVYVLANDCISVGAYNRLELKARSENLRYVRKMTDVEREMFVAPTTSLADFN